MTPVFVGQGTLVWYNLYRAFLGEPLPFVPLDKEPIKGTSSARAVFKGADSERTLD